MSASNDNSEDRAEDRANTGTGHDAPRVRFALQSLHHRGANGIGAAVDREAVEDKRQLALPVESAACRRNRVHDPTHYGAGRNEHPSVSIVGNDRRGVEAIFDLGGTRVKPRLQPYIELGPNGNFRGAEPFLDDGLSR